MSSASTTAEGVSGGRARTAGAALGLRGAVISWAAVAGWGAGLIELALGAGALTGGRAVRGAGTALVALGAAGLAWGAATLVRGRIVAPRTGIVGTLAGIAAGIAALAADPARMSVLAIAAGSALLVGAGLACATRLRDRDGWTDAASPRLWTLVVAAFVVAALVTPALGATEAGRLAPDHGTHGVVEPGHH